VQYLYVPVSFRGSEMTRRLVENKWVYPWRRAFWKPNSSLQLKDNREALSRVIM